MRSTVLAKVLSERKNPREFGTDRPVLELKMKTEAGIADREFGTHSGMTNDMVLCFRNLQSLLDTKGLRRVLCDEIIDPVA